MTNGKAPRRDLILEDASQLLAEVLNARGGRWVSAPHGQAMKLRAEQSGGPLAPRRPAIEAAGERAGGGS